MGLDSRVTLIRGPDPERWEWIQNRPAEAGYRLVDPAGEKQFGPWAFGTNLLALRGMAVVQQVNAAVFVIVFNGDIGGIPLLGHLENDNSVTLGNTAAVNGKISVPAGWPVIIELANRTILGYVSGANAGYWESYDATIQGAKVDYDYVLAFEAGYQVGGGIGYLSLAGWDGLDPDDPVGAPTGSTRIEFWTPRAPVSKRIWANASDIGVGGATVNVGAQLTDVLPAYNRRFVIKKQSVEIGDFIRDEGGQWRVTDVVALEDRNGNMELTTERRVPSQRAPGF